MMAIHVYPVNDTVAHDIESEPSDCKCVCDFDVLWLDEDGVPLDEPIVVHEIVKLNMSHCGRAVRQT